MPQALLEWEKRAEVDPGVCAAVTTSETQRMKELSFVSAPEFGRAAACTGFLHTGKAGVNAVFVRRLVTHREKETE